jgi:hypothetical protein
MPELIRSRHSKNGGDEEELGSGTRQGGVARGVGSELVDAASELDVEYLHGHSADINGADL